MTFKNRRCALSGMVFLMSMGFSMTSFAGGINGNEQSVVSVIHGQFEQGGVIYSVKQEYINSALEYLSRDDVDLTADQAQQVISEIYANVATGVESGYLTEIGRTQTAPPETEASKEGESQTGTSDGQPGDGGETETVTPEGETGGEENPEGEVPEESAEAAEPETEPETEAPAEIPQVISILELVDKAPPQSYDYLSKDTDSLMAKLDIPYQYAYRGLAVLFLVMLTVAGISWEKGLLTRHRNHKLRNVLKAVLTVEIAALSAVFLGGLGFGVGAFQDGAVLNKLADTGYYHTIYDELRRDTSISFALLDIPDEVMDQSITYERVVLAARQQVESDLSKGVYQADTSMLTRQLEADIKSYLADQSVVMTEQAERGLELLMNRLEEKYTNLLRWPFAPWWADFSTDFWNTMKVILPCAFAMIVLAQLLLVFLHHYRHRGLVLCGKGVLAGGILVCAGNIAGMITGGQLTPDMEPEYMKTFFELYIAGIWRTGILLGGIGILIGVIYLLIVRAWKEGEK